MSELVTWLLPTRNAGKYLIETLRSLKSQTYPHHKILAWDNGSTDSTVDILRAWIPNQLPGEVIADKPFELLGDSLAALVLRADTKLVARIDADDLAKPNRLIQQLRSLENHPDWGLVAGRACQISSTGLRLKKIMSKQMLPEEIMLSLVEGNPIVHPSILAKRSAILAAGNYASMGMGQDLDLWYRLVQTCKMGVTQDLVLDYRVHEQSVGGQGQHQWQTLQRTLWSKHAHKLYPTIDEDNLRRFWERVNPLVDVDLNEQKLDTAKGIEILNRMMDECASHNNTDQKLLMSTVTYERLYKRLILPRTLSISERAQFMKNRIVRKFSRP